MFPAHPGQHGSAAGCADPDGLVDRIMGQLLRLMHVHPRQTISFVPVGSDLPHDVFLRVLELCQAEGYSASCQKAGHSNTWLISLDYVGFPCS